MITSHRLPIPWMEMNLTRKLRWYLQGSFRITFSLESLLQQLKLLILLIVHRIVHLFFLQPALFLLHLPITTTGHVHGWFL